MYIQKIYTVLPLLLMSFMLHSEPTIVTHSIDNNTLAIEVTLPLKEKEVLYTEWIHFSVNSPEVSLSEVKPSIDPENRYDTTFKNTKLIFPGTLTFSMQAHLNTKESTIKPELSFTYYTNFTKGFVQEIFPLAFNTPAPESLSTQEESSVHLIKKDSDIKPTIKYASEKMIDKNESSFSETVSNLVKKTESTPLRIILVFLLGVLLSLTPCIYPMIPITIGILQAQGSKSFWYNFFIAFIYTLGMATTFAIFGLLAGCIGPICGQLLMQPLFVAGLVIILLYLALSMLGFYEIYIPRFMQPQQKNIKSGSLLSVYLFGAASGTISSPCVSPGLALLLSIVATLGNGFLGFLLLFSFGIGLSMPLLIVGTFSSSLNMLPRAGMWMIEVKKIFGFIMFFMIFYYMSYVIPMTIIWWLIAIFTALIGLHYIHLGTQSSNTKNKSLYSLVGIAIVATSIILGVQAYKNMFYTDTCTANHTDHCWNTGYAEALQQAQTENKLLFIDCWAQFCSICIAINKGLLNNPTVVEFLENKIVGLKVDGTFGSNHPYEELQKKYNIIGFPTFLLVDPKTGIVLKQWSGELYSMKPEQFIADLQNY